MQEGTSWKTKYQTDTKRVQHILCKPKIHYRVHKTPQTALTLSHTNIIYALPFYIMKIRFNIIIFAASESSKRFLSFKVSHETSSTALFSCNCATWPSYLLFLYHPNKIFEEKNIEVLQHAIFYSFLLRFPS